MSRSQFKKLTENERFSQIFKYISPLFDMIWFVHKIFIYATLMPFKLKYFFPSDNFKVKATDFFFTFFGCKLEILTIFVNQFLFSVIFSYFLWKYAAQYTILRYYDNMP